METIYRLTAKFPARSRGADLTNKAGGNFDLSNSPKITDDKRRESCHHVTIARGSWLELETQSPRIQIEVCGTAAAKPVIKEIEEIRRTLAILVSKLS